MELGPIVRALRRNKTRFGLIALEIAFGKGASRYDRETDRHDHAICSACGKLVDFDLPGTVALTRPAARASKFKAESVHLTLVGLCPKCRDGKPTSSS